jgi:hypothetical protein
VDEGIGDVAAIASKARCVPFAASRATPAPAAASCRTATDSSAATAARLREPRLAMTYPPSTLLTMTRG